MNRYSPRGRSVARVLCLAVGVAVSIAGCGDAGGNQPVGAIVTGRALLDGANLDAEWIGARVRYEDLMTPCQQDIPAVRDGKFEIEVFDSDAARGCGQPGAEILLWAHTGQERLFATSAIPWPSAGTATADIEFSTSDPQGAAPAMTDFSGEVLRDGDRVAPGALVEAFVDDTVCGVATIRSGEFVGYILSVVGPDSRPGCRAGTAISFRVDGAPATEAGVNSPDKSRHLDLTVTSK